MNCEEFEMMLADALGSELSEKDRPSFERHLSQCENCRREYETAQQTITMMQSLTAPRQITVQREADRLVIQESPTTFSFRRRLPMMSLLRYAASVLIAFTAGYGLHAGLMITDAGSTTTTNIDHHSPITHHSPEDFQSALAGVHAQQPSRSNLAKCMIAMFVNK